MSADSLVDPPNSGLSGTATFSVEGGKLSVNLVSRPGFIADGYAGRGTIEAELQQVEPKR
jgi:hypothetical protein